MKHLTSTTQNSSVTDYYKVVFLGRQGIGKTSIIQRLVTSKTDTQHQPTLGIIYHNVELEYQNNKYYIQLWDVSNTLENQMITFLSNTALCVLIFDYNDKKSLQNVRQLFDTIKAFSTTIHILFVGNRAKNTKQKIPKELSDLAQGNDLKIYPITSQNYDGLSVLLQAIVQNFPKLEEKK